MRQRREDIDRVRGLAILLVVFGHLVARWDPAHVSWYEPLRRIVYSFHMPLFLYLSGLTAMLSGSLLAPRAAWGRIAEARAKRLLVPFFGLGVLVVLGKLLAARGLHVDNAPSGLAAGLENLVWHTAASPALSIWYLFVLFVVSLAAMMALDGRPARLPWLLAGSLALYGLAIPPYLYLDRICGFGVFFILGAAAGGLGARWEAWIDRWWRSLAPPFLGCLIAVACTGPGFPSKPTVLLIGALSMPVIHGWLRCSAASSAPGLLFLGRYSFMIYLFNTMCIGLAKGILLLAWPWDGAHFLPFAAVLMLSGTLGPIGLKRLVLKHSRILDRMTD